MEKSETLFKDIDKTWWERACKVIPGGTCTESKKPSKYVEAYPKFVVGGVGPYLYGLNGKKYVDFISGLGAIVLGYEKMGCSWGNIHSFPAINEIYLAELLKEVIPCAEMSKFFKTGSEACSAAIKAARAYTKKDKIVVCGYHGWHDWFTISTDKVLGIPKDYSRHVRKSKFNDKESFKDLDGVAAVILEPMVYEEPKDGFLEWLKRYCWAKNVVLIFDEMVTGFRFPGMSAQTHFGVTPDLACFGKAMGNGAPIAVVCGNKDIMSIFANEEFFCSGTYNSDLFGINAAINTIDFIKKRENGVYNRLQQVGQAIKFAFQKLNLPAQCKGTFVRTTFDFPTSEHKSLFWQECANRGVLFGYANFPQYLHPECMENVEKVMQEAGKTVLDNWENPSSVLIGPPAKEVFRLR